MSENKPNLKLIGKNGNAMAILRAARKAIRKHGTDKVGITESDFLKEATSGDYNHVLQICMKYFDIT